MDGHFRAFSFVDRITRLEPGVRIRGSYFIPTALESFPVSLAAEAVGQLAAWAAMAAVDFASRPLAGIAGSVEVLSSISPGRVLELTADLESIDADAAAYGGIAEMDGKPVVRLTDCVGPMMPLQEYDDPLAVRDRFGLLCGPGATPGGFSGLPALPLNRTSGEPGKHSRATLSIPAAAPFFADHFPRRQLFPGSLLIHAGLELARDLAAELPTGRVGAAWMLQAISEVKLRTFTLPGELLELEATLLDRSDESALFAVQSRNRRRTVADAQVRFARGGCA